MQYFQELKNNYRLLSGYIGITLIIISVVFVLPLLILPVFSDEIKYLWVFLIPAFGCLLIGLLLRLISRGIKQLSINFYQSGIIVLISWTIVIFLSALPFYIGKQLNFTQSIFESVSGWTTTGFTVADVENCPKIFLLWRSMMQLFGGAGLAVLMLSTIIGPYGFGLYRAEARTEKLLPNIVKTTKIIITIYFGYNLAGILLYILAGMNWFDAINHTFTALSTAGFSTRADSIGSYNNIYIELITIILMILGAMSFGAHFILLKGKFKEFFRIAEVKLMFILFTVFIPIFSFLAISKIYTSLGQSFRVGAFQVISALTTTGFSTVSLNNFNGFAIFILVLLMFVGGSYGSTAGGIKLYRVYVMFKTLIWSIKRYFLPRNIVKENYFYTYEGINYIDKNKIIELSNFLVIYIIVYLSGVTIFLLNGFPLQESIFEFASSIGNVGLSIGIINPDANNSILWTVIAGMFLGRLEFFVIFYAVIKIVKDIFYVLKFKSRRIS